MTRLPVIIETDVFSDVDDVGALAVAHDAADRGLVELLAIGVNTPSRWGHRAVGVINAFFGRPVPVGGLLPLDDGVAEPDYARLLATGYPSGGSDDELEAAVAVHRRALASATEPVTVISLGFLTNLRDLLDSGPDEHSPLGGTELVAATVGRLVVMGGRFPTGREFNLVEDVPAAAAVLDRWPTPVDLLGFEVGAPVISGASISADGAENVIGAAYRAYCGAGVGRESWDPLTVLLALGDPDRLFDLSAPGRVRLDPDGTSTFAEDPSGRHRITRLVAPPEQAAAALDRILARATQR